jgi:hypothetical protein
MKRMFLLISTVLFSMTTLAQENLIRNGDFADSSLNVWNLNANGAQAGGKIEASKYIISISSPGSNETAPQLSQQGITLAESEGYTLSFKVSANDTGFIKVALAGDGNAVFSDTTLDKVPVNSTGKSYSLDVFVQKSTSSARLLFNCGISKNLIRIAFDSVSLVKKRDPIIKLVDPGAGVRWLTGTERQITWKNSGTLDQVKIQSSSNNGATWNVVVAAATNQKNYWWEIPASAEGENCLIIVSNTSGTVSDTSTAFKIVKAGTVVTGELVKNGDFFDSTEWKLSVLSPAKAHGKIVEGQYVISIDTIGDQPWQVKLEQDGITLEKDKMYRLAFDAYASDNRDIFANVGGDNGSPAWSISGTDTVPVKITTEKARYFFTMGMKQPTASNIRIEFNCGNGPGKIYIDNVSLIQMDSVDVFVFKPSSGDILKSGSKFNIEWLALKVTTVNLQYSTDSGSTWDSIAKNIDNLGAYSWTVPEKSSENCFVRLKNAANDSVLATSSRFQINKFGVAVKTGELVTNGRFVNKLQGWTTAFNGAQGQANVSSGTYELSVTEPGSSLKTIELSQGGLPMLGGKEYTLSFNAYANGNRSIELKLIPEGDTTPIFDSTLALPTVSTELTYRFTSPKDALVKLAIEMGGSRAGVFIDNISFYTGPKPTVGVFNITLSRPTGPDGSFAIRLCGRSVYFVVGKMPIGVISIYTIQGSLVRNVPITERTLWDGKNAHGAAVARGVYVAMLKSNSIRSIRQFILK